MQSKKTEFFYLYRSLCIAPIIMLLSCNSEIKKESLFVALDQQSTGLTFVNAMHPTPEFNLFKYMYYYNGAGVGAGDFNNDGKIDLFFAANQGNNELFLNEGNLHFKDVTREAKIPEDGA